MAVDRAAVIAIVAVIHANTYQCTSSCWENQLSVRLAFKFAHALPDPLNSKNRLDCLLCQVVLVVFPRFRLRPG